MLRSRLRLAALAATAAARDEAAQNLVVLDQMLALSAHARGRDCALRHPGGLDGWRDMLRRAARYTKCGHRGVELQHPSWRLGADAEQPDGARTADRLMTLVAIAIVLLPSLALAQPLPQPKPRGPGGLCPHGCSA